MWVVLWIILSVLVGAFARSKGRSVIGYFLISLFFSPVLGMILAIIAESDYEKIEEKAIQSGKRRKCPYCAEMVRKEARICKHCGKEIAKIIPFDVRKKN